MSPHDESMASTVTNPGAEVSTEVLTTLAEISEQVNSSLDLDEVLARTAGLIKRLIDYEIFGVLMIEEDGGFLRHRFSIGYPRELADNLRIPVGQGITGTAAASGLAVRVSDTSRDPRYINAIDSVRSELAVPLMLKASASAFWTFRAGISIISRANSNPFCHYWRTGLLWPSRMPGSFKKCARRRTPCFS